MANNQITPITIARAEEALRQQRETFEQRKKQDNRSSNVRMIMLIAAFLVIVTVLVVCIWIIMDSTRNDHNWAWGLLSGDIVAIMIWIIKFSLTSSSNNPLQPVTTFVADTSANIDDHAADDNENLLD